MENLTVTDRKQPGMPPPSADASKITEDYCNICSRNTTWEEIRSWNNPYGVSTLHPTNIRVGWKCRTCGARKHV